MGEYTAPATLITSSCKIAKNTTDGWTKTLYSAGDPVTYASWEAFMEATANGMATPVFSPSVRAVPLEDNTPDLPCLSEVHLCGTHHMALPTQARPVLLETQNLWCHSTIAGGTRTPSGGASSLCLHRIRRD